LINYLLHLLKLYPLWNVPVPEVWAGSDWETSEQEIPSTPPPPRCNVAHFSHHFLFFLPLFAFCRVRTQRSSHQHLKTERERDRDSLWNVGYELHTDAAGRPRRLLHCILSPWKLQKKCDYSCPF
jgi:hypothetical protein